VKIEIGIGKAESVTLAPLFFGAPGMAQTLGGAASAELSRSQVHYEPDRGNR
jgi:hypothetical protein